eukprot:543496-Prorocentrum_minimum.AAC.2
MDCIIVAKGPTAKYLQKSSFPNTQLVAVNQAVKLIDKPDFVVMNDMDAGLYGLEKKDIMNVQTFCIPEFPHVKCSPDPKVTSETFKETVYSLTDHEFSGNFLIYNLHTSPKPNQQLPLFKVPGISSTHYAMMIASQLYDKRKILTYGFGIGTSYHRVIRSLYPHYVDHLYTNHTQARRQAMQIASVYNIELSIE